MNSVTDRANFVLQALSYLGQSHIDDQIIEQCAARLDNRDMKDLSASVARIPGWMADIILKIQQTRHGQMA